MESDREQADLGPDVSADLNGDTVPEARQPTKRFIGRRAAAEKAAAKGQAINGIEDSAAVQGAANSSILGIGCSTDSLRSRTTSSYRPCLESSTLVYLAR